MGALEGGGDTPSGIQARKDVNCIDAVEGTVKSILVRWQQLSCDYLMDDAEHIRNVRAIIEATEHFVTQHREICATPEVLRDVLYSFAKELWRQRAAAQRTRQPAFAAEPVDEELTDYHDYYYDTLYHKGVYPR
jgi:hypothetical protein